MKILILGGTSFTGRILVENLVDRGEKPVLFNRGKHNPGIFPGLRKFKGDRESDDIKQICAEEWDVVVDFWGQYPDNIELITNILKGKTGRYIFVSTASVYLMDDDNLKIPIREDYPIHPCTEEERKDKDFLATYSQKKSECERILLAAGELDVIIFRPALIYGRYDPTDRFYYWLYRAKNSSKILLPDNGIMRITNTYSEDFARLIEQAITIKSHNTVYNAVTHDPVTLKEYLDIASGLLKTSPQIINAPAEFFTENNVQPWGEVPMWRGGPDLVLDNAKVKNDFKIEFKPFKKTVEECIDYYASLGWQEPKYGLSLDKEGELIEQIKPQKL